MAANATFLQSLCRNAADSFARNLSLSTYIANGSFLQFLRMRCRTLTVRSPPDAAGFGVGAVFVTTAPLAAVARLWLR